VVWVVKVRAGWADTTGLGHWVFPMLDQVRIDRPVQLNLGGMADHIARYEGAEISLVHLIAPDAPSAQAEAIHEYHERLGEVLTVPWDDLIHPTDDLVSTLTELSRGANLVMLGALAPISPGDGSRRPHCRGCRLPRPPRPYTRARETERPSASGPVAHLLSYELQSSS